MKDFARGCRFLSLRILLSLLGLAVSFALSAKASASTFNLFTYTYTYTLAGSGPVTVIDTFSLPAELPASSLLSDQYGVVYTYDNVILNDDPNQVVSVVLGERI